MIHHPDSNRRFSLINIVGLFALWNKTNGIIIHLRIENNPIIGVTLYHLQLLQNLLLQQLYFQQLSTASVMFSHLFLILPLIEIFSYKVVFVSQSHHCTCPLTLILDHPRKGCRLNKNMNPDSSDSKTA